jgi:radical SAM superfamily enzyme YgiQ (UPF0313 family)
MKKMKLIKERNLVRKNWREMDLRVALCYPNKYHIGMSSFAIHLIQCLFNSRNNVACERIFLPYTKMLLDSFIPPYAKERDGKEYPLIIGGGPCISGNPEPIADFFDLLVVGDIEPVLDKIIDHCLKFENPRSRLNELLDTPGIYLPSLVNQDTIKSVWVDEMDNILHPLQQIVPLVEPKDKVSPAFGKTFLMEISRGCGHGCRFCLIGYTNRPYRERSLSVLEEIVDRGTKLTGVEKVSLIGAAISDYKRLEDLCLYIVNSGLNLSLSSLRADRVTSSLIEAITASGQQTIALAPETGTNKLRSCTKKQMTNDDIARAAEIAAENGIHHLKLYYLIGLPNEEESDLKGIIEQAKEISQFKFKRGISLSINPFVPKAHTPFQWDPQPPLEILREKKRFLESALRKFAPKIDLKFLDFRWGKIQALLSRGDRHLSEVIRTVAESPISLGSWRRALSEANIKLEEYINRFSLYDEMPWDHILLKFRRESLIKERMLVEKGK